MDPYWEGSIWSSLHSELNIGIANQISEQLPPNYLVSLEEYLLVETIGEHPFDSFRPDVRIEKLVEEAPAYATSSQAEVPTPTAVFPAPRPAEWRIPYLRIFGTAGAEVTIIELLTPANQRAPGYTKYLEKRQKRTRRGVHFLEIDLMRRGKRTIGHPGFEPQLYLAALHRAGSGAVAVWTFSVEDSIPPLPVPLEVGDADLVIRPQEVLNWVYRTRKDHLRIDCAASPPSPAL